MNDQLKSTVIAAEARTAGANDSARPAIQEINRALAANVQCAPGILARDRWVLTPIGELSYLNDRELFVQVSTAIYGNWYGHVLRLIDTKDGGQQWAAVLVQTGAKIDAPDVETLFRRVRYYLAGQSRYEPPWAQEKEDVFAIRSSFDDAALALARMIERFDILNRANVDYDFAAYTKPPSPTGHPDCSCMNVYGLRCDTALAESQELGYAFFMVPRPGAPYWDQQRFLELVKRREEDERMKRAKRMKGS